MKNKKTTQKMEQEIFNNFYLREFESFDGESFKTFNIYDLNQNSNRITVAISSQGRITVDSFDLQEDEDGHFFEFGYYQTEKIYLCDFE